MDWQENIIKYLQEICCLCIMQTKTLPFYKTKNGDEKTKIKDLLNIRTSILNFAKKITYKFIKKRSKNNI